MRNVQAGRLSPESITLGLGTILHDPERNRRPGTSRSTARKSSGRSRFPELARVHPVNPIV